MNKPQEPQIELAYEYVHLLDNESIYDEEIDLWFRLDKIAARLAGISLVAVFIALLLMREPQFSEVGSYFGLISMGSIAFLVLIGFVCSYKQKQITSELGLSSEERLFLRLYETYNDVFSCWNEPHAKRKLYLRKSALENAEEPIGIVDGWEYGNINLIRNLVGDQIDLIKNNFKRLVLSNIAKGDDATLEKVTEILIEFCKYIRSPSVEKLGELNDMIKELPYREYKILSKKERMRNYLYSKPRMFRLLFASSTTIAVIVVLLYLEQNIGLAIAVAVPCFWGAFAGFDKLFGLKEK